MRDRFDRFDHTTTSGLAMADDHRNFRSYYYSKVGFPSVQEKKSLEILFKDNEIDEVKLSQFCARFPLPFVYRILTWKILLKVLPKFQSLHSFAWDVKRNMYAQSLEAVSVMQMVTTETPAPIRFLKMYLLTEQNLLIDHVKQETDPNSQNFLAFATIFNQICESDEEAYWLSRHMFNTIKKFQDLVPNLMECTEVVLLKEDKELSEHLNCLGLNNLPLTQWFCRCFAGVLPVLALIRIWDRVIGGAFRILPYVAVSLFVGLRRQLLLATNIEQVLLAINNISEETAEVVVNISMEVNQEYNTQMNETMRNR